MRTSGKVCDAIEALEALSAAHGEKCRCGVCYRARGVLWAMREMACYLDGSSNNNRVRSRYAAVAAEYPPGER